MQPLRYLLTHIQSVSQAGIIANQKRRFQISIRGSAIWNNFVANIEKELESNSLFKAKVKTKLLDIENEVTLLALFSISMYL